MVDVLKTLPDEVTDFIEYKEWSIKNEEGIGKFVERQGRVLPTLCINEKLVFESIIPTSEELYDALKEGARNDEQRETLERAFEKSEEEYE